MKNIKVNIESEYLEDTGRKYFSRLGTKLFIHYHLSRNCSIFIFNTNLGQKHLGQQISAGEIYFLPSFTETADSFLYK